jgi:hypothetical protein
VPRVSMDEGRALVARLRGGYEPTDAELSAWTVADTIDILRGDITEADLTWIAARIADERGARGAFFLALSKPLATKPEIKSLLASRFETADARLRTELLWRLLDDPGLPDETHRRLFEFVTSEWDAFKVSLPYLGAPSQILEAALRRIAECPRGKRWIYLCCLPEYAADQQAVTGLLALACTSDDGFLAHVARVLMERFYGSGRQPKA